MKIESRDLIRIEGFEGKVVFPADAEGIRDIEELNGLYSRLALIPGQTHSLNVGIASSLSESFPETDALVTFQPDLSIGVRTADCVPILIYCKRPSCIAAVHAGWKGSLGGILDNVIDVLESHGVRPGDINAVFGPSISRRNYEVDESLASRFAEAGYSQCISRPDGQDGKPHIDLQDVNVRRLLARGVAAANIHVNDGCTFGSRHSDGSPVYQSHRRSHGHPGRNLTFIRMNKRLKNLEQ